MCRVWSYGQPLISVSELHGQLRQHVLATWMEKIGA